MTRFYANENFPLPAVIYLRQRGHDVLTIQEAGYADQAQPDEAVLAFSTREERMLLTFNRKHFVKLHKTVATHAGIVVCSFDPDFAALAERIDTAVSPLNTTQNQLIRVNRPAPV